MVGGAAVADDKDKSTSASATFEALDRDSDQRLSQSEASADESISARFAALDANRDGYLTKREYGALMKKTEPRPMPEEPRTPNN